MNGDDVKRSVAGLLQKAPQYLAPVRLLGDATQLIERFSSFIPNVNTFASGNKDVCLFYLYGTLPIVYCGTTYNIPMTIFFDLPYPNQAPRLFVTPTRSMQIKPNHRSVDRQGVVYHQLLHAWDSSKSNLMDVMLALAETFGDDPPVFSTGSTISGVSQDATKKPSNASIKEEPAVSSSGVVSRKSSFQQYNKSFGAYGIPNAGLIRFLEQQIKAVWGKVTDPIVQQIAVQKNLMEKLMLYEDELKAHIDRKKKASAEFQSNLDQLQRTKEEVDNFVEEESKKTVDYPSIVVARDPVSNQLIDLIARVAASEDLYAIYMEGLQRKIIGINQLPALRDHFKQEFKDLVLIQKIVTHLSGEQS